MTEAKVIDRKVDNSGDSTSYYLIYAYRPAPYDPNQEPLIGRDQVGSGRYYDHQLGDYVLVRYLQQDPTKVTSKWHRYWVYQLVSAYAVVAFLLCLQFLYLVPRKRQLRQEYIENGQIIPGYVVSCTGEEDSDDNYMVTLHYGFAAPHGERCQGNISQIRNDLKKQILPTPSSPVAVIYLAPDRFFVL